MQKYYFFYKIKQLFIFFIKKQTRRFIPVLSNVVASTKIKYLSYKNILKGDLPA